MFKLSILDTGMHLLRLVQLLHLLQVVYGGDIYEAVRYKYQSNIELVTLTLQLQTKKGTTFSVLKGAIPQRCFCFRSVQC